MGKDYSGMILIGLLVVGAYFVFGSGQTNIGSMTGFPVEKAFEIKIQAEPQKPILISSSLCSSPNWSNPLIYPNIISVQGYQSEYYDSYCYIDSVRKYALSDTYIASCGCKK